MIISLRNPSERLVERRACQVLPFPVFGYKDVLYVC